MASTSLGIMFQDSMSSTALDRFGGSSAWDMFVDWTDLFYDELIEGKTCLDCGNCSRCGVEGHEAVGLCREADEWVSDADVVADIGCESFVLV